MRIAVIGAGIMGVCTAWSLAERGHQVVVFEQFAPSNPKGSSHGRSRIIRKAYPDAFYTAIMDEGYGLWHGVQRLSNGQFVFEPGLLYFGSFESENVRDVHHALQALSVPHELLEPDQVAQFSRVRLEEGEIGIFTPEAGWVDPDLAIRALLHRFADLGGICLQGAKFDIGRIEADFDRYVLCPGPWITNFVPVPVTVTLQTYGYVGDATPLDGPVWIEDSDDFFYGFPSEPGERTFKIGVHSLGPAIDPNSESRLPTATHAEAVVDQARRRFGIENASCTFKGCLYTSTADEDFLMGRHGENGFFVSACSGHGFKFGPWIGKTMANFVEDRDEPENHPRFCWPPVLKEA